MSGTIEININLRVNVVQKEGYFLASCDQLDVHAEGDTEAEAMHHIQDALQGFLECCIEMGTLDTVMRDAGFNRIIRKKTNDRLKSDEKIVAFPFVIGENHGRKIANAH